MQLLIKCATIYIQFEISEPVILEQRLSLSTLIRKIPHIFEVVPSPSEKKS